MEGRAEEGSKRRVQMPRSKKKGCSETERGGEDESEGGGEEMGMFAGTDSAEQP